MFKKNTLLILGAGASSDLNFPLGRQFKLDIADLTSFNHVDKQDYGRSLPVEEVSDEQFDFWLHEYVQAKNRVGDYPTIDRESVRRAMRMVSQGVGFAPSIDVFLKMRSGDRSIELCSKGP